MCTKAEFTHKAKPGMMAVHTDASVKMLIVVHTGAQTGNHMYIETCNVKFSTVFHKKVIVNLLNVTVVCIFLSHYFIYGHVLVED